ncbi:MAG: hypothetical protein ACR2O4_12015 [Hyphomicrobiaceae bacterium]
MTCHILWLAIFVVTAMTPAASRDTGRVALLIADTSAPPDTCRLDDVAKTLETLRFEINRVNDPANDAAIAAFRSASSGSDAAIIYACNATAIDHLPGALQASELNYLFLLRTAPDASEEPVLRTDRNDLMIVHVLLRSPENDRIFAHTLAHKLRRPFSDPRDIISRTITSSYYRSRGTMLINIQGTVAKDYMLAEPPTDLILDAWSRIQHSGDKAVLEAFIEQYPDTLFADLARSRLEKLP